MSCEAIDSPRLRRVACNTLVAAAVALLCGCSYRMDKVENPVKMPVAWDSTNTPNAKEGIPKDWWKGFGSPVLDGLIEQALKNNPNIIATEERLKQAERSLSGSRDGLFPELSVNGSTSKGVTNSNGNPRLVNPANPTGPTLPNPANRQRDTESTSVSAGLRYDVDLWGGTAARYRASVAGYIGTKYDADLAHITLASNVAQRYFALLSIRSRVNIARENLAIAEQVLRITDARYRNGVLRQYDLAQQTTSVLQQRTNLIPLENQLRQSETALGLLLGVTPQDFHIEGEPIEQLTVPEIAPWLPGDLLLRRPDLASAETDMAAAKANLVAARASLIPVTLSLNASTTKSSQELFKLTDVQNFSVSGALAIAEGIFNFRRRHNAVLNAKSNEYIALITYANTIRTALKEIDDNLASVNANLRTEESQRATLEQARRAFELNQIEYREGSASQQEVLDTQRSLFSAQDSLAQARLTRLNSAVTLYVALGGGWDGPSESR